MNNESALAFLLAHQPLPSDRDERANDLLQRFEEVRRFFTCELDHRAVPLLIGALGEGDGHGIYPMVETTLLAYPEDLVVSALKGGLASAFPSVRYWSSQFAANYPSEDLLEGLTHVFRVGGVDERIAAVTAIEAICGEKAREKLRALLALGVEPTVRDFIKGVLEG